MNLTSLKLGYSALVSSVHGDTDQDPVARRLLELGFIPGTLIQKLHKAPLFGDPVSFIVRGTHVALRKDEAKRIEIDVLSVTQMQEITK